MKWLNTKQHKGVIYTTLTQVNNCEPDNLLEDELKVKYVLFTIGTHTLIKFSTNKHQKSSKKGVLIARSIQVRHKVVTS